MYNNQDRIFLQLVDETEEVMIVKSILKSPLGLAQDIIKRLFENRFDELNDDLDEIKQTSKIGAGFLAKVGRKFISTRNNL